MTEERQKSSGQGSQQKSPLKSDRGNTRIENTVVARIAGIAAQEIEGVNMGGGASRAAGGLLDSVTGGRTGGQTRGVSVEVGEVEAAVDLTMAVDYGKSIPQLSEAVRRNVVNRIENLVGLKVTEVNITVNDIILPDSDGGQREVESGEQQESRVS